jgi:putative lipoprotein
VAAFSFEEIAMRIVLVALALAACSPAQETKVEAPAETAAPAAGVQAAPANAQEALARMPAPDDLRAAGVDFRAVGQEPGWILDIYTRGIIKFVWDYGESYAEFAVAAPTNPQEGATRYEAHSDGRALVVTIRRAPCQDAMSGEAYPSTVEVEIDGRALNGCGRSA